MSLCPAICGKEIKRHNEDYHVCFEVRAWAFFNSEWVGHLFWYDEPNQQDEKVPLVSHFDQIGFKYHFIFILRSTSLSVSISQTVMVLPSEFIALNVFM